MVMRTAWLVFLVLVAGCTRDWDGRGGEFTPSHVDGGQFLLHDVARLPARNRGTAKFASQPDRGELLVYPQAQHSRQHGARRDGAYTWHRAELSEAHALRAILDRKLRITTPSGERLSFDYQRHVEHPSGDWTWIGRLEGGDPSDEAILTFGERAAFGSIAQPAKEPLRLTVRNGVSWLVETDAAAVARMDNAATRPRRPDFLLPPETVRNAATSGVATARMGSEHATPPVGAPVVDVVLGYTTGFAAGLGGDSQALTRLNNLVDITNQAYLNAQVNAQVRLVRAVQVAYPDATRNDTALEELTGYRPGTGGGVIPVSPALQALHQARDAYGADLVSLVRKFNDPENDGCGIAWLLGGGQTGIDGSDAPFAFSVVSDGTDAGTDGKTYFCRDETLAHEFGHNLGSQHDRTTATVDGVLKYGVFPYSFGYKTGAGAGNFYTIMAYGESGQTRYRVFSNPRTTFCGGWACGIENDSDNARSLTQTIPIIATFRATIVPLPQPISRVRYDVDGDRKSDLVWVNPAAASFGYWIMNGAQASRTGISSLGTANRIAAGGDTNADGLLDLFMTNDARDLWLFTGNGTTFGATWLGAYPSGWAPVGAGDIDANGSADLLWLNATASSFGYWIMQGSQTVRTWTISIAPGYRIAATGDFNGDGRVDVLWTSNARDLWLWTGNGTSFQSAQLASYPAGWLPIGAGDVDGDGKSDLLWQNDVSNSFGYWLMDGGFARQTWAVGIAPGYRIAARGDYNGDGKLDLVWTSNARDLWLWAGTGAGSNFASSYLGAYDASWSLVEALNQ